MLAAAVFGVTVAIASASYFGLERPILRLKGRITWWDRKIPTPLPATVRERQRPVSDVSADDMRPVAESGPHPPA